MMVLNILEGETVKPLCIILPQMSGYIRCLSWLKSMSFMVKNDHVLDKYDEIWDKIKTDLNKISQHTCL